MYGPFPLIFVIVMKVIETIFRKAYRCLIRVITTLPNPENLCNSYSFCEDSTMSTLNIFTNVTEARVFVWFNVDDIV